MSNNNKTPPAPPPAMPTVLKKHVAAVHTSGELSLVERKIANILLLNAYDNLVPSDGSDARHTIPVSYLGHMVGWEESKNVTALKAALRSLQKTVVEFNVLKDGREDWESMSLLSYARVRDGLCTYGYVGELARKLHDPEVFATINVGVQKRFKGGYSLTLYENCVRFKNVKSTGWWDLEKFRRLMGAEAAMYDDFKRLSAFVVKKSVEEINAVSDIRVVPEYRREGRKVVAIRFAVEENPQQSLFGPNPLDDEELVAIRSSEAFQRLKHHGISERLALMWLKQDPEQARLAIDAAEAKDRAGKIKTSTGAYIRKLIEDGASLGQSGYAAEKAARKQANKDKALLGKLRTDFDIATRKAALSAITPDRMQALALEYFEGLTSEQQGKAGRFDPRSAKFSHTATNIDFHKAWLPKRINVSFDQAAFDAYAREQGHDPEALRASAALLPPEEQAA